MAYWVYMKFKVGETVPIQSFNTEKEAVERADGYRHTFEAEGYREIPEVWVSYGRNRVYTAGN